MRTPATNFEALLGQARDCGLTLDFATAYEINVSLDEADCCGGLPEQSKSITYTDNGSYTVNPDEGYTLSAVNITVDVDQNLTIISELQLEVAQLEGEIATITSLNISENGTFTPPAGILGYNSIDVNVSGGGGGVEGDFGYINSLSIIVPNKEPLPELYYSLFNNVKQLSVRGKVNYIAFPEGTLKNITSLYLAFSNCNFLTSLTFPEGALTLAISLSYVFNCCSSLTSLIFPEGALTLTKSIGDAFAGCNSLTSLIFPEGALTLVTAITRCFYYCRKLSSVILPKGALTLARNMRESFKMCTSLQDLTIYNLPNINLTDIGFNTCTRLTLSSLQNIVNALPNTTSGYECTLGATNLAKLSDTDIQIATDKGWTLN